MKKRKLCLFVLIFSLGLYGCGKPSNTTSVTPKEASGSTQSIATPKETASSAQPISEDKTKEIRISKEGALYDLQGVTDTSNITLLSEQTLTSKDFIVEGPNDFKSDNNFCYLYGPKGSSTPTYIVNGNMGSVYKCSTLGKAAGKLVIAQALSEEESDANSHYLSNDKSALVQKLPLTNPEKLFLGHWYNKDTKDNIWVSKTEINALGTKLNIKNKTYDIVSDVHTVRLMANFFAPTGKIVDDFNLRTSTELAADAKFINDEVSNSMIIRASGNSEQLSAALFVFYDDRKSAKVFALGYPGTYNVDFLGIYSLVDDKQSPQ